MQDKVVRYVLPFFLVLFNFLLKRIGLTANSIALDEPFSIYVAQFDVTKIIQYLSSGNNPPLFEIILHYWIKFFGVKASSVRFLPCLFSALTALYVFKITNHIATKRSALIAYCLFTFSNYELFFAHEARVYSLFTLLTCISFYYFFKIQKEVTRKNLLVFGVINLFLIYAHFFGFFVLFVQFVSVCFFKFLRQKSGKELMYVALFLCAGYSPYIYVFTQRFFESSVNGTWIAPVTNLGQLHHVLTLLTNNSSVNFLVVLFLCWITYLYLISKKIKNELIKTGILFISLFFLFFSISIVAPMPYYWEFTSKPWAMISYLLFIIMSLSWIVAIESIHSTFKMILLWFVLPLLIMFLSSFKIPMFIDRYYIFTTPAFFILIAIIVDYFTIKIQVSFYWIVIALLLITSVRNEPNNRDVKPMVDKIAMLKNNQTAILMCPDYFDYNFTYYYNSDLFTNIGNKPIDLGLKERLKKDNIFPITHINQLDTVLIKQFKRVIYLDVAADFSYPSNNIYNFCESNFKVVDTLKYGDALQFFVFE